jgi:PPM family protein phosphatase
MGGARGGEIASRVAATALGETDDGSGEARVVALSQAANRQVDGRAREDSDASGMGTTITVALFENGIVSIGHVGDSRAYLIRDRKVDQLTEDHSLVAELVRTGRLSPEEAESHPQRSVITRALGTDPDIDVDTFTVDAEAGDIYLICSDGLSDMVDRGALETIMREHRDNLDEAAKALVQAANRAGGEDNITAVLFEIAEGDAPQEPDEKTAEQATMEAGALHVDDEDTLHPEDRIVAPRDDTMVVPASEIAAALPPREERFEEEDDVAGPAHKALALLVILVLLALIVVLVWWGLAR